MLPEMILADSKVRFSTVLYARITYLYPLVPAKVCLSLKVKMPFSSVAIRTVSEGGEGFAVCCAR